MTKKNTVEPNKKEETKEILPKSKLPLVFISHVTKPVHNMGLSSMLAEEYKAL